MTKQGVADVLGCLLNQGVGTKEDTRHFVGLSHEILLRSLINYFNAHRHFLGYCHIETCQALNDKGVDVFLKASECKFGFQIKSHFDVQQDDFAANVKRQFAEALTLGLDHFYILICSALIKEGKKDLGMKVAHLQNDLRLFKGVQFETYGPLNTIVYFKNAIIVSREELLERGAINDKALHEYEKGYEHLPEIDDEAIRIAKKELEFFGSYWIDSDAGQQAFYALQRLIEKKQAEQFHSQFLPTLSPEIQELRTSRVDSIRSLLQSCRECKSSDDRSEYKLSQRLDPVPETMIPYTSLPNLLRIKESLEDYLEVHRTMDPEQGATSSNGFRTGEFEGTKHEVQMPPPWPESLHRMLSLKWTLAVILLLVAGVALYLAISATAVQTKVLTENTRPTPEVIVPIENTKEENLILRRGLNTEKWAGITDHRMKAYLDAINILHGCMYDLRVSSDKEHKDINRLFENGNSPERMKDLVEHDKWIRETVNKLRNMRVQGGFDDPTQDDPRLAASITETIDECLRISSESLNIANRIHVPNDKNVQPEVKSLDNVRQNNHNKLGSQMIELARIANDIPDPKK
jgi:hypothetical protein